MNEYVEDLLSRIAEKNRILNALEADGRGRFDQALRIAGELDGLLYKFYKGILRYSAERNGATGK